MTSAEEREMWDRLRKAEYDIGVHGERVAHLSSAVNRMTNAVESLQVRVALIVGGIVVAGQVIPFLLRLIGR